MHVRINCIPGMMIGFGMQYTGSGVYYGEYKKGRRSGAGIVQGANGDRIEGTFVSETRQVGTLILVPGWANVVLPGGLMW